VTNIETKSLENRNLPQVLFKAPNSQLTWRSLEPYGKTPRFPVNPEPALKRKSSKTRRLFVVQKHSARRLHYDFRLEVDGVLKSWAVPKGPSFDPAVKRLAVAVEDHPLDYADFEGVIPEGQYGAGTVAVWDHGNYEPKDDTDVAAALAEGELKFELEGRKLKGIWVLVRMRGKNWLLIKHQDRYASTESGALQGP
jgi:bifunctional non-homologous end joining protein LigD